MVQLKTGWKHWDQYLSRFVGEKLTIMEIGVYEGVATSWFLKNLMTNPESKFYAVDTFGGSPEYEGNIDFTEIEKKFYENIKKTGRDKQVTVMKMMSYQALIKLLNEGKTKFDIIFIDASHEAKDVLSDNVMAWSMLKEGGVLINDDYEWNLLDKNYFRPKLAIDSFVRSFKPEIKILYQGYQFIVEKLHKDQIERPIQEVIKDTIYRIFILNKEDHYKCEIPTAKDKPKIGLNSNSNSSSVSSNSKGVKQLTEKLKTVKSKFKSKYLLNHLLLPGKNILGEDSPLLKKAVRNYSNQVIYFISNNIAKKSNSKKAFSFLNRSYLKEGVNDQLSDMISSLNKDSTYISLNVGANKLVKKKDNQLIINSPLLSETDVIFVSDKIGKKVEYLFLTNTVDMSESDKADMESFYLTRFFYLTLLALTLQEKGGTVEFNIITFSQKGTQDLIYLLSYYYKSVTIENKNITNPLSLSLRLLCKDFKGVDKGELAELYKLKVGHADHISSFLSNKYNNIATCDKQFIDHIKKNISAEEGILKQLDKMDKEEKRTFENKLMHLQFNFMNNWFDNYYFSVVDA